MSCVLAAAYLLAAAARLGQHTWPVVSEAAASTHVHFVSYVQQPPGAAHLGSQPTYCTTSGALLHTAILLHCTIVYCYHVQVRDLVDGVVVITDEQIVAAMQLVFERMKLVVEPSGAAGLAAVLAPGFDSTVKHAWAAAAGQAGGNGAAAEVPLSVGIILCGGNLDFESKGLFKLDNWVAQA